MVWQNCLCKNSNVSSERGIEIIASRSSVLVLLLWLSRIIIHVWQWRMDIPFWAFVLSSMSGCQKWMRKLLDCHEKWSTSATLRSVHNFSNKSTCLFAHCAKKNLSFFLFFFHSFCSVQIEIYPLQFWNQSNLDSNWKKTPFFLFFDSVPITTATVFLVRNCAS